jgi:uncharacterized protein YndB with AHSA1/START domain
MNEGTIQPLEGRSLIRFERRYPHSVERVWAALTEPDQLRQWFGEGDIELELAEGGRFDVVTTGPAELVGAMIEFGGGEEALERHDTVLQVDPPRLLEHTFYGGESVVRWELQPDGDGCLLRLTHTMGAPVGPDSPKALAGWHTLLDLLGPVLDGAPEPWTRAGWNRNHEIYLERAGR